MVPSKPQKTKAGTIMFLLFICTAFACPSPAYSPDKFSEPDKIGASKIPRFGDSRIPVIIMSGDAGAVASALQRPFFSNDLEADTFRNYWHTNSLSAYDSRLFLFEPAPGAAKPVFPKCGQPVSEICRKEWLSLIVNTLNRLAEADGFEAASFDINGRDETPDGFFDGIIVLADGVEGAHPLFTGKNNIPTVAGIRLGPVLLAGLDTSNYELLRGFARLLGFADMSVNEESNAGVFLSLVGNTEPDANEEGLPMLDGYSRLRAGWARPVKLNNPLRKVYMLPARTSGEVYIIGGDAEFFLIENRAPGGLYDSQIKTPGLAIYHIDETPRKKDKRALPIMNLWPDVASVQSGQILTSDQALFREGDYIRSDYQAQNPFDGNTHPPNTNWNSGEPSDVTIKDIDTKSHFPMISVTAGIE